MKMLPSYPPGSVRRIAHRSGTVAPPLLYLTGYLIPYKFFFHAQNVPYESITIRGNISERFIKLKVLPLIDED
jgi:hypothetical protein